MKQFLPSPGPIAAELREVLETYAEEYFSPSELIPRLRQRPSWSEYLEDFEPDRGQPAALGRYLNELGLTKAAHHRTRGSLYSSQGARERLAASAAVESAAAMAAGAAAAPPPIQLMAGESAAAAVAPAKAPALGRRKDDRAAAPDRRQGDAVAAGATSPAAAPAGGGARTMPMIGWRRRATDLGRSPQAQASGSVVAATLPPPSSAAMPAAYAAAGAGAPPLWAGAGSAVALPGQGGLSPYLDPMDGFGASAEAGLPLAFYWNQIRRHLYKILLAAAAVTVLVGIYTLRIPKLYAAVVTLRIDFETPQMIAYASSTPAFDPTTLIQTEIADVGTRAVILDAIRAAHLDLDPNLQREIGVSGGAAPTISNPNALDNSLVGLIASHVAAVSPNNTNNINISYRSLNPATSAVVANALGDALIRHEFQTRQQEQNDQLKFMQRQFQDVQARVEKEQAALLQYQHANNILNPSGQDSLETATVSALNSSYLTAQAALTRYQAEVNVLDSGHPTDALLASDDGQALRPAYQAWQTAEAQFEQVAATRGPANPAYIAAQQALAAARQQLDQATTSVKHQIQIQFQRAQDQERLIAQQLAAAKASDQAFNDKAIEYATQKQSVDADQKLYNSLLAQIKQQQLSASMSSSSLRVTNRATPDPVPVYPSVRKNVVLALLFSLFFGCGLAVLAGYLDRSFTSPEALEQYLRVPVLGALPVIPGEVNPIELAEQAPAGEGGKAGPRSAFAESILMLRTALLYAAPHGASTFSVTSAQPQEGKSLILANLAISMALHGAKVLVVDADIRRPTQHRIFDLPNQIGLSSVLRQLSPLEEGFRATTVENLYVMTAGPAVPNPSELIATMLSQVLAPLAAEFDYVLVDAPPVLGFADAISVATAVEGTILVVRAGKTPREQLQSALRPLQRVRARVLGVVLNQVSKSLNPYYAYYSKHYAEYYHRLNEKDEEKTESAKP